MLPSINTNANSSPNWISAYPQGQKPSGINSAGLKPLAAKESIGGNAGVNNAGGNNGELDIGEFDDMELFDPSEEVNNLTTVKADADDVKGVLDRHKNKKVTIKEKFKNGFSFLGRHLQSICRTIREHFNGKIEVSNTPQVDKSSLNLLRETTYSNVTMDKVLAARKLDADALDSNRNFTYADLNLQTASLRDIQQRAGLQDCWLLSSISSMVTTLGTGHLSNIIKPNITDNNIEDGFLVRLGNKTYTVPSKELSHGGERIFSNSAPWVNVLECAMQMHLIDQMYDASKNDVVNNGDKMFDLAYRSPGEALRALMPGRRVDTARVGDSVQNKFDLITKSLNSGEAVVLGKREGLASALLTDGVATDHAVSVVSVGDKTVDILDPYGRMVRLTKNQLSNFEVNATAKPDVAVQPEVNANES